MSDEVPVASTEMFGPPYGDTGDPTWFVPVHDGGDARPGDRFAGPGRHDQRIYPDATLTYAHDTWKARGHLGLHQAIQRADEVMRLPDLSPEQIAPSHEHAASIAAYEVLEWAHSLHDEHMTTKTYKTPTDVDAKAGKIVLGAIAARNASHHGLRRIVGVVPVARPVYVATEDGLWHHTGTYRDDAPAITTRWREQLPGPALHSPALQQAYKDHLAGIDVAYTFRTLASFFFYLVDGETPPGPPDFVGWNAPRIVLPDQA